MAQQFLQKDFRMSSLSVFIGDEDVDKAGAQERSMELLEELLVVPRRDDQQRQCPTCGEPLGTVEDAARWPKWRFQCPNGHEFNATEGTFLAKVDFSEIGHKIALMAYWWVLGLPQNGIMEELELSADTAYSWYSSFRDVAAKIVRHDLTPISGSDGNNLKLERMYRRNILDKDESGKAQFLRFMRDIHRAFPGIGLVPMNLNLEECRCHECEPH